MSFAMTSSSIAVRYWESNVSFPVKRTVSSSNALTSKLSVGRDRSDHLRAIVASAHFTSLGPLLCQFIFWVNDLRLLKRLTLLFNILEFTHLELLNLSNNAMFSVVSIQSLASVVFLDVSYNPIDDSGFKLSAKLQALEVVKASGTRITHPALVARFAPSLEVADFAWTALWTLKAHSNSSNPLTVFKPWISVAVRSRSESILISIASRSHRGKALRVSRITTNCTQMGLMCGRSTARTC
jgi:hypothetical protein